MISVELKIAGEVLVGEGEFIVDALNNIAKPMIVKGKGILRVINEDGIASKEIVLNPGEVKRLMVNKTYRIILAKRLFNLLGQ